VRSESIPKKSCAEVVCELNRSGRSNVQPQVFVSLVALFAVCLAFSPVTAQAQTYTPNDNLHDCWRRQDSDYTVNSGSAGSERSH